MGSRKVPGNMILTWRRDSNCRTSCPDHRLRSHRRNAFLYCPCPWGDGRDLPCRWFFLGLLQQVSRYGVGVCDGLEVSICTHIPNTVVELVMTSSHPAMPSNCLLPCPSKSLPHQSPFRIGKGLEISILPHGSQSSWSSS